jgi:hypothetical protein
VKFKSKKKKKLREFGGFQLAKVGPKRKRSKNQQISIFGI